VSTNITDEQIQQLVATARPFSLALLSWGPERHREGADAIELEHQRRMVSLRADGVIAILCPVSSDTVSGVAIMDVSPDEAQRIMDGDPCVEAGMIVCDIYHCASFPGDTVPTGSAP
jgi:hypothetical protein